MLQIWLLTSKGHIGTHSNHSKFNMFHPQILVLLTGPTGRLQKAYNNCQLDRKNPNIGIARENTTKRNVQHPQAKFPPKYKSTKEK